MDFTASEQSEYDSESVKMASCRQFAHGRLPLFNDKSRGARPVLVSRDPGDHIRLRASYNLPPGEALPAAIYAKQYANDRHSHSAAPNAHAGPSRRTQLRAELAYDLKHGDY